MATQMLELPTKKSAKDNRWVAQKFLMIGQSGLGKSSFWAQGDKTLFLECESGLNHLEVFKLPIRGWGDFTEAGGSLMQAAQAGTMPYDTIVMDTVDRWIDYANEEVIARGKAKFSKVASDINTIGDIPNGAGWYMATELIGNYLGKLEKLGCAVVLIGHLATKEVKPAAGQSYHRETISIGGKMGEGLLAWSDHTLMLEGQRYGDQIKRTLRTRPTQTKEGKSRGDIVPDGMAWTGTIVENYQALRALFT